MGDLEAGKIHNLLDRDEVASQVGSRELTAVTIWTFILAFNGILYSYNKPITASVIGISLDLFAICILNRWWFIIWGLRTFLKITFPKYPINPWTFPTELGNQIERDYKITFDGGFPGATYFAKIPAHKLMNSTLFIAAFGNALFLFLYLFGTVNI